MKKIYSIALLATISLSLKAQQQTKALFNKNSAKTKQIAASSFRPEKDIQSTWDTVANVWVAKDSVINTYSPAGNVLTEKTYSMTGGTPLYRKTNIYNTNNKLLNSLSETYSSSAFHNSSLYTYTYNINGLVTYEQGQAWNSSTNSWQNQHNYSYTYNSNNQLLTRQFQTWNSTTNVWEKNSIDNYSYNVNNQNSVVLTQNWSLATSTYTNSYKYDYTYNVNGEGNTIVDYNFDGTNWQIQDSVYNITWHKWNTTFDDSEPNVAYLKSFYDNFGKYKLSVTYDTQGNLTDDLQEKWNGTAYVLDYDYVYIYTYDANNSPTQLINKNSPGVTQIARNNNKHDYSRFVATTASLKDLSNENYVELYPNPTKDKLIVNVLNTATLTMINTLGNIVLSKQMLAGKNTINMSEFADGVYFVTIQNNKGETKTEKILLQK